MSKEAEVIELIAEATTSGKQKWEPTAVENNFSTTFADGFSANIMSTDDPQDPSSPDIVIELRNRDGLVVVSILNSTEGLEYKFLRGLHNAARRSALKVDDTLDAMLKSLKPK